MRGAVQFCYAGFRSPIYENPTQDDAYECAVDLVAKRLRNRQSASGLLSADGKLRVQVMYVATDESGVDVYWFQFLE